MKEIEKPDDWRTLLRSIREKYKALDPKYPFRYEHELAYQTALEGMEDLEVEVRMDAEQFDNPLDALSYYADLAFIPPPEVVSAFRVYYTKYLNSGGDLELEEVFFGPKKPGVGNHASRRRKSLVMEYLSFELTAPIGDKSQTEIAQEVIQKFGLLVDVESLLRRYRRFKETTSDK